MNDASRSWFQRNARIWSEETYDGKRSDTFAFHRIAAAMDWLTDQAAGSGLRILDLGCGPGLFSLEAGLQGHSVVGVDAAPEMLQLCRERLSSVPKVVQSRLSFVLADVRDYRPTSTFDAVTAFGLLPWFDDPRPLFATVQASVRRGGFCIMGVANSLVVPEGAAWIERPAMASSSMPLLMACVQRHFVGSGDRWQRQIVTHRGPERREADQRTAGRLQTCHADGESRSGPERRFSPYDVHLLASEAGLEIVDIAGVGAIRTAAPAQGDCLPNPALESLRRSPLGALIATGFLALLKAT